MRFNEKRTCIEFLENGINCDFEVQNNWPIGRKELMKYELKQSFLAHKDKFAAKVQFISDPFYKAYQKAVDKVAIALRGEPLGEVSGTFILNCGGGVVKTAFYGITNHTPDKFDAVFMEFTRCSSDDRTVCGGVVQIIGDEKKGNYYVADGYQNRGMDAQLLLADFIHICGFLRYCDVETKILAPKEKHKDAFSVKYFNETKSKIEILDSTWFTNIIRTEGFGVSGHLRLQPYGPGMTKKKFIYIKAYEKEGYTITAKKPIE